MNFRSWIWHNRDLWCRCPPCSVVAHAANCSGQWEFWDLLSHSPGLFQEIRDINTEGKKQTVKEMAALVLCTIKVWLLPLHSPQGVKPHFFAGRLSATGRMMHTNRRMSYMSIPVTPGFHFLHLPSYRDGVSSHPTRRRNLAGFLCTVHYFLQLGIIFNQFTSTFISSSLSGASVEATGNLIITPRGSR